MRTDRTSFLDLGFDRLALDEVVERLAQITAEDRFGYVVTPNVDHIVRLHNGSAAAALLAPIYAAADYCLCDSRVLARLARFCGINLPVTAGSDLTQTIFARVLRAGDRVAVVGGNEELVDALQIEFPNLEFVQHVPPMGLAENLAARRRAASFIASQKARFTFICVGSPQQEMIAAEAARLPRSGGLGLCVGASLEFIAGHQLRAPLLVRRLGIEWAHRLVMNPRRMWKRYLVEGPRIFALTYSWVHKRQ